MLFRLASPKPFTLPCLAFPTETPIRLWQRPPPPFRLLFPDPNVLLLPWEPLLLVSRRTMRKMKFFFKWHWPLCVIRWSSLQGQNRARDRGGCVGGSPYEGPALLGPAPTAGPTPVLHLPHQLGLTKPGHRQCERRKGTFLQSEVGNKSQKGSSVSP